MRGGSHAIAFLGLYFALTGCRASFEDIRRGEALTSSNQGETSAVTPEADAVPESSDGDPSTIRNESPLPPEESESHGCKGQVVVIEEGLDLNRDSVLQATEVAKVASECRDEAGNPIETEPLTPEECPAQADRESCPANSDDPSQS